MLVTALRHPGRLIGLILGMVLSLSALADSRTLDTAYGQVKVEGQPKRVVALYEGAVDAAVAVGVKPVAALATRGTTGLARYMDEHAKGVAIVGTARELNLEAIVAQRPDLILASPQMPKAQYDLLSSVAPTVVPKTNVYEPDNWKSESRLFAQALGQAAKMDELIEAVENRAAQLAEKIKAEYSDEERTAYVVRWMPQGPMVMSSQLLTAGLLEMLGLQVNDDGLVKEGRPHSDPLSLENLGRIDSDWLFLATLNEEGQAALEAAKKSPAFARMKVVERNRVIPVDGQYWSSATGPIAAQKILDDVEAALLP